MQRLYNTTPIPRWKPQPKIPEARAQPKAGDPFLLKAGKIMEEASLIATMLDQAGTHVRQQVEVIKQKTQAFVKSLELKMSFIIKLENMPAAKKESNFREIEQYVTRNDAELCELSSQIEKYSELLKTVLQYKPQQQIVKTHKYLPTQIAEVKKTFRGIELQAEDFNLGMRYQGVFIKSEAGYLALYNDQTQMTDVFEYETASNNLKRLFSVNRHLKNFDARGDLLLCDTELYRRSGALIQNLVNKSIGSAVFLRDGKIGLGTHFHNTRFDLFDTQDGITYNIEKKCMLSNYVGAKKVTITRLLENPFLSNQIFACVGREVVKFHLDRPCYELMM